MGVASTFATGPITLSRPKYQLMSGALVIVVTVDARSTVATAAGVPVRRGAIHLRARAPLAMRPAMPMTLSW